MKMKHADHLVSELQILQMLQKIGNSPFIVDFQGSFKTSENLYFVLEYVKGCTLHSQIKQKNQQISRNVDFYAKQVIEALQFLHKNKIVYRDLKPENIMLSATHNGHIKLVDFGFAKVLPRRRAGI